MPHRPRHRSALLLAGVLALLAVGPTPSHGQASRLTQRRINEYAAACITAQMGLSGLKGTPRAGETPQAFAARVRAYLGAVDRAIRDLAPLRVVPPTSDRQPANVQRWARIATMCSALPQQGAAAHQAWQAYPRLKQHAEIGPHLAQCLDTIHKLLNLLRDARP